MNENIRENDLMKTEVRCDVCRKTFAAPEAGTRCPDCKIGRIRSMEKAAQIEISAS
jgi:phage FluMu protein Com